MYQRFILAPSYRRGKDIQGVISAAYNLLADEHIQLQDKDTLSKHLSWMRNHTETPKVNMGTIEQDGITISRTRWIKPNSGELIDTLRSVQAILEGYGIETLVLKSAKPGRVISEDRHQVIVEPFS